MQSGTPILFACVQGTRRPERTGHSQKEEGIEDESAGKEENLPLLLLSEEEEGRQIMHTRARRGGKKVPFLASTRESSSSLLPPRPHRLSR